MKVSKQPYRLWFQYLQECLNDKDYSKKVDREFYRSWHLNNVKTQKFDTWFKEHSYLFEEFESKIKLYSGKRTPDTILVEIPTNFNVHKIQKSIGEVVKGKLNKSNAKYSITSNRSLQIAPFDYFLWCYQWRKMKKYQVRGGLELIWNELHKRVKQRQERYSKSIDQFMKTGKGKIKRRSVHGKEKEIQSGRNSGTVSGRTVIISRNVSKCKKILDNVCRGVFPGDYSDH
jgi:hypothetical protein